MYPLSRVSPCLTLPCQDTRRPQSDDPSAPRAPLITAEHSMIDFATMTASRIVGTHRAISHQVPTLVFVPLITSLTLSSSRNQ